MNVWVRLQLIYDSIIGQLLVGFAGFIALLVCVYFILRFRQKAKDALAYRYEQYFSKVDGLLVGMSYVGRHKADFFGRRTIVQLEDEQYALSLVLTPDIIDHTVLERFRLYLYTLKHQHLPAFAPLVFTHDEDVMVLVEAGLISKNARTLPSLSEYMLDRKFGEADVELILLELARALAALHELQTETGEQLYHGFLLPSMIYLSIDGTKRIQSVVISGHGLAFALGSEVLHKRFEGLKNQTLQVESQVLRELQKTLPILAPEQKDQQRFREVTAAVDFYAFGALAVQTFSSEAFHSLEKVNWDKIPKNWQSFLKSCLNSDPQERPADFLSIQDHLYDPDLALTHNPEDIEDHECEVELEEGSEPASLNELVGLLQSAEAFKEQKKTENGSPLKKHMTLAAQYIVQGKWAFAKMHLDKAVVLDANDVEVNTALAIVCYEQKEFDLAESYYEKAKTVNAEVAKRFREHIAFRL